MCWSDDSDQQHHQDEAATNDKPTERISSDFPFQMRLLLLRNLEQIGRKGA
jgi:hypothetical protein